MGKVELAKRIATEAHAGQIDKGGNPYINHPASVVSFVNTEDEQIVAWLHDVVEDTPTTLADLSNFGFSDVVVNAVDAITKRKDEDRWTYLNRVKVNPIARNVKLADLKHNSDITRILNPTKKDFDRVKRYGEEIEWLMQEASNDRSNCRK